MTRTAAEPLVVEAAAPAARERLAALDVFRGATVAAMLLVNNPGSWGAVCAPLRHADWHGWTPTDLIFPFFLFIVGVSMALSIEPRVSAGEPKHGLVLRAARRGALLVLLGLLLTAFPYYNLDPAHLRLPGVLQRIGVCFFAAALVVIHARPRTQLLAAALLLVGYWAAMTLVPVPGYGAGNLTKSGNVAAWVDRTVLGTDHLWRAARSWDPEGLLSSLPATATVLLGAAAGRVLRATRPIAERLVALFLAGGALLVAGLAWDAAFPINKNLWTSSYVLFTAGVALQLLAACIWAVDVRAWRRWAGPLEAFGLNAIAIFLGSGIMARLLDLIRPPGAPAGLKQWVFSRALEPWLPRPLASLAFAAAFVAVWGLIAEAMRRRRVFLKV